MRRVDVYTILVHKRLGFKGDLRNGIIEIFIKFFEYNLGFVFPSIDQQTRSIGHNGRPFLFLPSMTRILRNFNPTSVLPSIMNQIFLIQGVYGHFTIRHLEDSMNEIRLMFFVIDILFEYIAQINDGVPLMPVLFISRLNEVRIEHFYGYLSSRVFFDVHVLNVQGLDVKSFILEEVKAFQRADQDSFQELIIDLLRQRQLSFQEIFQAACWLFKEDIYMSNN